MVDEEFELDLDLTLVPLLKIPLIDDIELELDDGVRESGDE
jgi:hypothetical protein